MAKKKLLSETQVRRFMGLAGIQPINEMGNHSPAGRDDKMEFEEEEEEMMGDIEPVVDDEVVDDEMDVEEVPSDEAEMDSESLLDIKEEEEPVLEGVELQLSQTEIVNEVARRVAKRIVTAKRAQQRMNEALGRKSPAKRKPAVKRKTAVKRSPAKRRRNK